MGAQTVALTELSSNLATSDSAGRFDKVPFVYRPREYCSLGKRSTFEERDSFESRSEARKECASR